LVLGSVRCTLDHTVLHRRTVDLRDEYRALSASWFGLSGFQVIVVHQVASEAGDPGPARVLGDTASVVAVYGNGGY
jgi:hypothetical protein